MRAVWSWLQELWHPPRHVEADEAAAALTGAGLEVEAIERTGEEFSGVVVAEVVARRKHPNADKLTLVDLIDEPGGTATEVVCGAPNVPEPGGLVLWAKPGAKLPGGFDIGTRKIKGVASAGMICAEDELGIGEDHDGIIVLGDDSGDDEARTPLGSRAQVALGLDDVVFDISVPANRPDALGHLGLARELVALIGGELVPPEAALERLTDEALDAASLVAIDIEDPEGCPRYIGRVIDGVTVKPSPRWLAARLRAVGVRPLSNLIDVTNYVLFELGQPLHAFDYAEVKFGHIIVRRARAGETMTTLDEAERALEPDDLLICDPRGPIALAGVMGGLHSEVTDETTRVLLETASFQPGAIRRTARRLGLHSEASHRFERDVDPELAELASRRTAALLAELGGGRVARGAVDAYPRPRRPRTLRLRASRASALVGIAFSRDESAEILARLGLGSAAVDDDTLEVTCPTHRPDLEREVDLIEEVIRVHGFDKVPATLPRSQAAPEGQGDPRANLARRALTSLGMSEAITFGFTSPERIAALRFGDGDRRARAIALTNPMSAEQSVMRTSLYPNLLAAIARNISFQIADVALFEVGCAFLRSTSPGGHPEEPVHACGVLTGARPAWLKEGGDSVDFFDAKGALERMLAELAPTAAVAFEATDAIPYLHPGLTARVLVDGTEVGEVGEVHPDVREAFGIEQPVFAFDLALEPIPAPGPAQMRAIPRFPAITRDVSLFVAHATPAAKVAALIAEADEPLVENVTILEEYTDPDKVPEGQKGMLWSITYRSLERTLTDADADTAHEAIVGRLLSSLPAERR